MKKSILACLIVCTCTTLIAQTQSNEINSTGKIGVGTTTPTEALDVNGDTKIDGDLVVKDSITVDKNLTIKQDIKVKGEAVFTEQLKAKGDVKILGKTKMKGDAFVEGTFKFKALVDPLETEDLYLTIDPTTGKAKSESKAALLEAIYKPSALCGKFGPRWVSQSDPGGNSGIIYTETPCNTRVGINTNDVRIDYKLGVNGKIICEEVEVKLKANWPDYVFEDNYELMSLDSVESFVNSNHHLPGVPSESQIDTNAVPLGEMNTILLEKIEELFLHSIELNKEVAILKAELNELKNKSK